MNILQIISKNDKYGAQRIFLDQVKVLTDMGNRVIVVGRGNEGYVPDSVQRLGVSYYGIRMKGLKDIFLLRQLIKKYNIQVIHTTLDRADYFGVILSKLTGVPAVSTMMVPRYHIGFRFADTVIVLSNKQRDLLLTKGSKPEKIRVIRPGIDVERFSNTDRSKREFWRKKLGTDNYSIIFCHISSMIPRKAHVVSIEIVAECKKRGESPLLVIIGDPLSGEYYESLNQKIADLGLERNVFFTGWTSEIPEILSLCHFTVLPSENEALGVVLMEGMAAGTPIIAREGEGGAELIEEYSTGFFYKPDEGLKAMAERITIFRRNKIQFEALSQKCIDIAEKEFSLFKFRDRLSGFYQSIIRNHRTVL